jgi:uncharacterized membrane protein
VVLWSSLYATYRRRHSPHVVFSLAPRDWLLVAVIGVSLLLATFMVQYGLARTPANRAIVILLSELVVAAIASRWLADEAMNPREWIGGAMIVAATLFTVKMARETGTIPCLKSSVCCTLRCWSRTLTGHADSMKACWACKPSSARPPMSFDGVWYDIGAAQIHLIRLPNPTRSANARRTADAIAIPRSGCAISKRCGQTGCRRFALHAQPIRTSRLVRARSGWQRAGTGGAGH